MEVGKLVRVKFFLLVGVHLALLEIGFCDFYSVSNEKYISESYFDKHDSLLDDSFDRYIANELPIGLCGTARDNLDIKILFHKRFLIGEGSHRKLRSTIKLNIGDDLVAENFRHLWKFVIVERLPNGVFADPFELQHLIDRGVFSDATVLGDTNLELPLIASNRSLIEVHVNINNGILSGHENILEIEIELPLHVRYPPLVEHGFFRVEIGNTDLFILHNIEENSQNKSCLFAYESATDSQTVVWEVPCGIKEHSQIVSIVTFVSAVVSAVVIVWTTLYYPRICKS